MRRVALLLVSVACVACTKEKATPRTDSANVVQQASSSKADVQRAIDSSLAIFASSAKKGDPVSMAALYDEDAIVLPPNAPAAHGRPEIQKLNEGMLGAITMEDAKFTTQDLIVTGEYAIETGAYVMTMKPKAGGKAVTDSGKYVTAWHKQPAGGWKMARDIFNSNMPAK